MRHQTQTHLSYTEDVIRLSQPERDLIRKASELADRIRTKAREINPEAEDDGQDTDLAQIEHNCRDLADEGFVPVLTHDRY